MRGGQGPYKDCRAIDDDEYTTLLIKTKINRLLLFTEITVVYSKNHTNAINTKWRVRAIKAGRTLQLTPGLKS
jgi:hypothetical protein